MIVLGLLVLICIGVCVWLFAPREPVVTAVTFDAANLDNGVDPWLAAQEARFDDITVGAEKRVIWATEPDQKTDIALVYIHGFSATSEEIRPLPDKVAQGLGANLVYTRLQGHGRSDAALAEATVEGWMKDLAETFAIARAIGKKTVVLSTSTGGTLAALALHENMSQGVAASIFVSPNFRVKSTNAQVLTWPGARWWLPKLAGETRSFEATSPDHARFWTNSYPTVALLPMAASVQAAAALAHDKMSVPALFVFDDLDQVIDHTVTRKVAAQWGGRSDLHVVDLGPDDDPGRHVIAGRVMSPSQTDPMANKVLNWLKDIE